MTFFNFYRHGFIRVAACVPEVRVSDPDFNAARTIELARQAHDEHAVLAVFPELGLSAYSNEDLFHQEALLQSTVQALGRVLEASVNLEPVLVVGAPLRVDDFLFNCGVVIRKGRIFGVAAKTYLPNYREFYEARQFRSAEEALSRTVSLGAQKDIPFGADLLFQVQGIPNCRFFVEICEDLWVPIPPSSLASLAGATLLLNLSASNITIAKSEYRHALLSNQSARCIAGCIYTAAGPGESTTDLSWDGNAVIYENGTLLAQSERFSRGSQLVLAEIDLDRLVQDRMRMTTFAQNARTHRERLTAFRRIDLTVEPPSARLLLTREIPRFPYVPADPAQREERCCEAYNIQVQGLIKRIESAGAACVVVGVSGGLDSTQVLLVCAKAMDLLGRDRSQVKAYTMPGFATSERTHQNARRLMEALGVEANEVDIRPACMQMFRDIGHPFAQGQDTYDVTFENVQAGARTSLLFRVANLRGGIVAGTGDLSELALGWCTYGVGDQMSHYNVNASVPKTLIQYLIRWVACSDQFGPGVPEVLKDILETEISPELIPGNAIQRTEDMIGPYELQDFNTFYTTRFGYLPGKIAFLAYCAWRDRTRGNWPDVPEVRRNQYTIGEIRQWLRTFLHRFFQTTQFKRSALPNGPKIGSGGSLSPRSDWRAPSDSEATAWLAAADSIPDRDDEAC